MLGILLPRGVRSTYGGKVPHGGWMKIRYPRGLPHRGRSKEGRRSWRGSSSTLLSDRTRRKGDVDYYYAGQVVHRRAPLFFRLVRHELGDNVSYINVGQIIGPLAHSFAMILLKRAAHILFKPFRLYCSILKIMYLLKMDVLE